MGAKIIYACLGLSGLSSIVNVFCMCLTWHVVVLTAVGMPVLTMTTSATTIHFTTCHSYNVLGWFASRLTDFCKEAPKKQDLHLFSQTACTTMSQTAFPTMCTASSRAYKFGLIVCIIVTLNVIVQAVAGFLAYSYITGHLKKQYRQIWVVLLICGAFVQFMALVAYHFLAIGPLDTLHSKIPMLSSSKGNGVKFGFIMLYVSVAIQCIVVLLTQWAKVRREEIEEERRENAKFMSEVEMYNDAVQRVQQPAGVLPQQTMGIQYAPQPGAMPPQMAPGLGMAPPPQWAPGGPTFAGPLQPPRMGPAVGMQQPAMSPAW